MTKQPVNLLDELDQMMTKIAEMQGDWDGRCSCTDCYWNMYHPTKRADNIQCVSESLCDTVMTPNTKECPTYWSYEIACGKPKGGSLSHD